MTEPRNSAERSTHLPISHPAAEASLARPSATPAAYLPAREASFATAPTSPASISRLHSPVAARSDPKAGENGSSPTKACGQGNSSRTCSSHDTRGTSYVLHVMQIRQSHVSDCYKWALRDMVLHRWNIRQARVIRVARPGPLSRLQRVKTVGRSPSRIVTTGNKQQQRRHYSRSRSDEPFRYDCVLAHGDGL